LRSCLGGIVCTCLGRRVESSSSVSAEGTFASYSSIHLLANYLQRGEIYLGVLQNPTSLRRPTCSTPPIRGVSHSRVVVGIEQPRSSSRSSAGCRLDGLPVADIRHSAFQFPLVEIDHRGVPSAYFGDSLWIPRSGGSPTHVCLSLFNRLERDVSAHEA